MEILKNLTGSYVNVATIVIGSLVGLLLKKGLPIRFKDNIMSAMALCVFLIGVSGLGTVNNIIVVILSLAIGTAIGTLLKLDDRINLVGEKLSSKFGKSQVGEGFCTATLLYVIGAMAVVGSLNSGMNGDYSTLYSKALIDGITAIVLTSGYGIGVMLSAIPVFLYQGIITVFAVLLAPVLSTVVINEMSAVGSLLIVAISLNMLKITKIKVMDLLPSIFIPIIMYLLPFVK